MPMAHIPALLLAACVAPSEPASTTDDPVGALAPATYVEHRTEDAPEFEALDPSQQVCAAETATFVFDDDQKRNRRNQN